MDLVTLLVAILIFLVATTLCVIFSDRLGLGSVVGFILAGVLVGPNTPGPAPLHDVDALQSIAQLGVVLFMFTVGLEMRPQKIWSMRVQIFGLGVGQVLVSALALGLFFLLFLGVPWQSSTFLGLGLAMSSTAVVMTILADRGELATKSGQNIFAILMAQDICIVPVMALIPILSSQGNTESQQPLTLQLMMTIGALLALFIGGRYIIPAALSFVTKNRNVETFGLVIFLGIISAAYIMELVGISMDLGAFVLGVMLSGSVYRYQVAALVDPYKQTLMGLFFLSVGMSINVNVFFAQWPLVLTYVAIVMIIKIIVLILFCRFFKIDLATRIRTAFGLSQVGEFTFVLFSIAEKTDLMTENSLTMGFLVISLSMIATPVIIKLGDRIARRFQPATPSALTEASTEEMSNHLVLVGLDNVGQIVALTAEKSEIPYIAIERDIELAKKAIKAGLKANFGDILSNVVQESVSLNRAKAVFICSNDFERIKAIGITLKSLYPQLIIYARVSNLAEKTYLESQGIKAATIFVESTLFRAKDMLKDLGVPEGKIEELTENMRRNNYELIRNRLVKSQIKTISD